MLIFPGPFQPIFSVVVLIYTWAKSVEERRRQLISRQRVLCVVACGDDPRVVGELPDAVDFSVKHDVECHALYAWQRVVYLVKEDYVQLIRLLFAILPVHFLNHVGGMSIISPVD